MRLIDGERAVRRSKDTGKMNTPRKTPHETLREIVDRSGLSHAEIARFLGYASTSGFSSRLKPAKPDAPVSIRLTERLMPILSGRGTPPITNDELIAISEARPYRQQQPSTSAVQAVPHEIRVKYRVEPGVFMDVDAINRKVYGPSGLVAVLDYPPQSQFAVAIADDAKSTTLLCVETDKVPVFARRGRRCVTMVERNKTGLAEVVIAHCDEEGRASGTMLGIVVGAFTRE